MVDQDDFRLVEAFELQRQERAWMTIAARKERVVAIDRPVGLPDEMRADQKREHQAGEEAGPRLLQAEEDELGQRRRQMRERPPNAETERIEQRADGMRAALSSFGG